VNALRKRRSELQTISGEDGRLLLGRIAEESEDGSEREAAGDEARLRTAIAGLDRKYRDVIVLRYLEDMSYEEIGDVLAVPLGTVATLLNRGKQRLRAALRPLAGTEASR
jgi:RNA polymerase sigma-70 factor (ECF subfamily)